MMGNAPPFCLRNFLFLHTEELRLFNFEMTYRCFLKACFFLLLRAMSPRSTFMTALQIVLTNLSGAPFRIALRTRVS